MNEIYNPKDVGLSWAQIKREKEREKSTKPKSMIVKLARLPQTLAHKISRANWSDRDILITGAIAIGTGLILLSALGDKSIEVSDKAESVQDAKNNGAGFNLNIPEVAVSLPEERLAQARFNIEQAERVIRGGSNNAFDKAILRKALGSGYTFGLLITTQQDIVLANPARVYRVPVPESQVRDLKFTDELDNRNVIAVLPKDMNVKIEGVVRVGNIYSAQGSNFGVLSPQYKVYGNLGEEANKATQWIRLP